MHAQTMYHVAAVMSDKQDVSISDLVPCLSASVEGVFVGALSPIKSSQKKHCCEVL